MDQINSNPYFNSAQVYKAQQNPANSSQSISKPASKVEPERETVGDFSQMFDDDALMKLQGNLEAIAQMAEKSLRQIDKS